MSDAKIYLWRVGWGRISSKPVPCIDLGDSKIKVVGDCRIEQKRDERSESYHETYEAALMRLLADAQRDVNDAKKNLKNSQRRLIAVKGKWASYVAAPR